MLVFPIILAFQVMAVSCAPTLAPDWEARFQALLRAIYRKATLNDLSQEKTVGKKLMVPISGTKSSKEKTVGKRIPVPVSGIKWSEEKTVGKKIPVPVSGIKWSKEKTVGKKIPVTELPAIEITFPAVELHFPPKSKVDPSQVMTRTAFPYAEKIRPKDPELLAKPAETKGGLENDDDDEDDDDYEDYDDESVTSRAAV